MNLVLLAGGKSQRMKRNKLFLPFDQEDTLLGFILQKVVPYFDQVCIVTNDEYRERIEKIVNLSRYSTVSTVVDLVPSCGPLGGIYTGLISISTSYAFFLAADQPFFSIPLIRYLSEQLDSYDAVVPKTNKGFEPLFTLYTQRCLSMIKKMLDERVFQVSQLFEMINANVIPAEIIKRYDPGMKSFINVNTETDYRLLNPTFFP